MTGLTMRQTNLLAFIKEYIAENGIPPSFDEMKDALDLRSKSAIHRLVAALEERGLITRLPSRARSIEVVDAGARASLAFLPTNHREFVEWFAKLKSTTPEVVVANLVREWAIKESQRQQRAA